MASGGGHSVAPDSEAFDKGLLSKIWDLSQTLGSSGVTIGTDTATQNYVNALMTKGHSGPDR